MLKKIILKIEGTIAWSRSKLGDKQFIFLSAVLVGISAALAVILLKAFAHGVFTFATYVSRILKLGFLNSFYFLIIPVTFQ